MTQQVYILEDRNSSLLKVGISVDVAVRVGQVNRQFGCDAEIIGILDVNDARKTERFIHGMLADCRVVGEWFEVDAARRNYLLAYFNTPIEKRRASVVSTKSRNSSTGGIVWKLKETMERLGVTQYALQKHSEVSVNTIKSLRKGETERPDVDVLNKVVKALRRITGKDIQLHDVMIWQPDTGEEA